MRRPRPFLAQRLFELAWSSPQVIAHRLSGADGAEQSRMVMEKVAAGIESWNAVATYAFALQRSLWRDLPRYRTWNSYFTGAPLLAWMNFMRGAERGLSDATAPFHRRAGANARRLASASRRRRKA